MKASFKTSASDQGSRHIVTKRKVNPLSPPTTLELNGIQIHFPFRPYDCQKDYMGKVLDALLRSENALLESPTGTGKTLCLLCSALAWQREQSRLLRQVSELQSEDVQVVATQDGPTKAARVPTIIYASRTHSQLSQVVRELRNTRYRPNHAVLGSREHMCVHPKVKKQHATASDINFDCNRLAKERKCRFRNNLDGFTPPSNELGAFGTQPVMDMEELVEMGKERKICPFYHTRSQVENAELILVPYNYLFDKDARSTTLADIQWSNAIVIFDEAHNLESFASDSASFELSSTDIAGCIQEIQRIVNHVNLMPDCGLKEENLLKLKAIFLQLEEFLLNMSNRTAYSGEFIIEFFKRGANLTHANHELFVAEIRKLNDFVMDVRGTSSNRGLPKLEHFVQCLKRVFGEKMIGKCIAKTASYRVHVSEKENSGKNDQGRVISYWCFAPALAMQELQGLNVRSIIVTSGTLSPLPSYSLELGIKFPHTLENPHVIEDDQIHVRVFGQGPTKKLLSSSYERRKDEDYYQELGNTLVALSKVVPMGMLVFFPSYGVMETCIEKWGGPATSRKKEDKKKNFFAAKKKQGSQYSFPQTPVSYFENLGAGLPWKRLLANKSVVVEPRSSGDLNDAISEFKRYLALPNSKGVVLMGVCRGKISEGIDFAHDMSRAVIITGLPFPPAFDPKVKLKREFLDDKRKTKSRTTAQGGYDGAITSDSTEESLSGHDWYTQQAHRAVNQAIGRTIRNMADYGAVILLDSRFGQPNNQKGLSKWVRPRIRKDEGFGTNIHHLGQFYRQAAESRAKQEKENEVAILRQAPLSYDEEVTPLAPINPLNSSMTITVVSHKNSGTDNGSENDGFIHPDDVVARIDVSKPAMEVKPRDDNKERKAFSASSVITHQPGLLATNGRKLIDTKSTASILMSKVSKKLSSSEQSIFRKSSVAMKEFGDKKDTQGYLRCAMEVCSLLARKEPLESVGSNDTSMLFLFLHLQPKVHRAETELASMKFVFDYSNFGKLCKENLEKVDFGRSRQLTATVLFQLYSVDNRQVFSSREFLTKAQRILKTIMRSKPETRSPLLDAFIQLIPTDYGVATRSFLHEMIAKERMEKLKSRDKDRSVQVPEIDNEIDNIEAKVPAKRKPMPNEDGPRKTSVNPYLKQSSKAAAKAPTIDKPGLTDYIKTIEKDTYVKESPADVMATLQSNVPKDFKCQYCSNHADQPYISPCGHIGCEKCWSEWLRRSTSCPTCRKTVNLEELSKVVFSKKSFTKGASITLAQLNESDEELEIVR